MIAPIIIVMAVVFWIMGSTMKDLTVTPKNAFLVAIIGTIIATFVQFVFLTLYVLFYYIIPIPLTFDMLQVFSTSIAAFFVYIPLAKKFFKIETGQAIMVAIVAAIVTLLMTFVADNLVNIIFLLFSL
jgi:hypothetical protein